MKQIYDMPIKKIFSLTVFLTLYSLSFSQVVYVTVAGAGIRNGTSWQNAYSNADFRVALKNATNGTEFWIAEGKYYAGNIGDSAFKVPAGVKIYGGFPSVGNPLFTSRNPILNSTIFDGDINNDDIIGLTPTRYENSLTLFITNKSDTNSVITFDGCTIRNANNYGILSDSSTINLINCTFLNINSSAINSTHSKLTLSNCRFENNNWGIFFDEVTLKTVATTFIMNKRALYGVRSLMEINNCFFDSNNLVGGTNQGGAICYFNCNLFIDSCTFERNYANEGAAIYGSGFLSIPPIISNCKFTSKKATNGVVILSDSCTLYNCEFKNNYATGAPIVGYKYSLKASGSIIKCRFEDNIAGLIVNSVSSPVPITIDSCYFSNNSGTAVYAVRNAPIKNCTFLNNNGPSINHYGFNTSITNCIFKNNIANDGGAAVVGGMQGGISIVNCTFERNKSTGINDTIPNSPKKNIGGGAVQLDGINHNIINSVFISNSSNEVGGAVYLRGNGPSKINSCTFYSNKSKKQGGAIQAIGVIEINNCVFTLNYSNSGPILSFKAAATPPSITTIRNSTFNNNFSNNDTGMIYIHYNSVPGIARIYNNIFWNNQFKNSIKHFQLSNTNLELKNNIIQTQLSPMSSGIIDSSFNYSFYPLFIDSVNVAGNDSILNTNDDGLRLRSCSPAINFGDSNRSLSLFTDIIGNDRVYGLNIDAGAYEYQGNKTANTSPNIQIAATNNNSCSNQQMVFKATFQDAGTNPYFKWQKNGVDYSNNNDSIFSINNNSLSTGDTITCVLYSSDSCALPSIISSNPVGIIVHEKPNFDTISGANIALLGSVMNYAVTSTSGSVYNWFVNGGSILSGNGTNAISILWNSIGTYFVNVIESSAHGCLGDTSLLKVVVKLSDSIYLSHDTIYSSSSGDTSIINVTSNNNWQVTTNESWITLNPTSGNSNGAFDVITSPNTSSRRTGFVTVTCGDSSRFILVNQEDSLSTGLSPHEIENAGLILYPNPTSGEVIISSTTNKSLGTIKIFNLTGKLIEQFDTSDSTFKMNVANFPAGIYLVLSANEDFKSTVKLVIK